MRHFDVQLIGGNGTETTGGRRDENWGEKNLVATLPVYLKCFNRKRGSVVTGK
jgi:preprotein translocase subunit SecA